MGIRVCVNYSLRTARDSFRGGLDRFMVFATKTVGEAMPAYDAVVIGSGYGGGVAASRLARMGLRLAVLEQGRLWRPGDFPTTGKAAAQDTAADGPRQAG
jgi:NADPH-dependent 2,4-dienoyl-CoA reductase/sulfur reductase-like enzyme